MNILNQSDSADWDLVMDSEQLLINKIIEERKILWLCHFTPRKNLENIKKFGLKPKNLMSINEYTPTDQYRWDNHNEAICMTISKPNAWMFNKKVQDGLDLCLILINSTVLFKKSCLFYPHNAATRCYRNVSDDYFKGEIALEKLFKNPVTYEKTDGHSYAINRSNLQDCEPTSDQAEVQCLDIIEPKYVQHIFEDYIPLTYQEIITYLEVYYQTVNLQREALIRLTRIIENTPKESISQNKYPKFEKTKKIINNCSNKESMNIEEKNDASTPFNSKGLKKSEHKFENTEINKIKPYNETTQNNYSSSDYSENGYLGIVIIIILIFIFIF